MTTVTAAPPSTGIRPSWVPDDLFPFTSRYLNVDGARMHYVDEGRGPVLLMLPGSPMWSFLYRYPIRELRDRFRCIAVDLPGLGLSEAPLIPGRAFQNNAAWFQGFVRALDLRDITLMVHANAGPSGLEMAVREHDRIKALVICNSFGWSLEAPHIRRMIRFLGSAPFAFINTRFNLLPRIAVRTGRITGRFSMRERAAILGPFQKPAARRHLQNLVLGARVEWPMFRALTGRLSVFRNTPALLMFGAQGELYKAGFLTRWQELLPNHKTVVFESASHFIQEDEPERFTEELKLWLWEGIE